MIIYLLVIGFLLCVLHCVFKYNAATRLLRKIPGDNGEFLIGNARTMMTSQVGLFYLARRYAKFHNGIYAWWSFFIRTVHIYNPEDIEKLISTTKHMEKSGSYKILKPWLGEGLLISNGLKWQQRRKILTPAFHFNILRKFFVILEENSQRLAEAAKSTNEQSVDIIPIISEYTLNSICETAMGTRMHEESSVATKSYKEAIYQLGKLCIKLFSNIFLFPDFMFNLLPVSRNTQKYLKDLHFFTKRIIEQRKKYFEENLIQFSEDMTDSNDNDVFPLSNTGTGVAQCVFLNSKRKKTAMLDLLIAAEKEGLIDGTGIQEEVDTFMFEGHDTTAVGLTFCLMLLANHKEIQDKIVAELRDIFGDSDRPATMEDMSLMRYMECCIKESLRLYPPVPFIGRMACEPVQLSGYTVPAGTFCQIHIYDLHRREDLFENALAFDPDRFLPEKSVSRHNYAYIPFSAGPRNCIGQRFAMLEMKSCLAALLRKFQLLPVTRPENIEFMADIVLRSIRQKRFLRNITVNKVNIRKT